MPYEVEEELEFDRLISDKQHKELMGAIKELLSFFQNDDRASMVTLKQTEVLMSFISTITKPPTEIKINQDQVINSIKEMTSKIDGGLRDIQKTFSGTGREFEITNLERGFGGLITGAKIKQIK